jgi:hypothetical protein
VVANAVHIARQREGDEKSDSLSQR